MEVICRLLFSYLIFFLFEAVHLQKVSEAYVYCTILTFLWSISLIFENQASTITYILAPKIKAGLSMFLFCKILTMTSFALRSKYIGIVTNLLAYDLSNLDERIFNIFMLIPFAVGTIGYTILIMK